jgi:hypothetical protein
MSLSKYLKGIPAENQVKALEAASRSIYSQHLMLLQDIHQLSPSKQAEVIEDLSELKADAAEILALGVVRGLLEHQLKIVDRLNVGRELTLNKLAKREAAKVAAHEKKTNPLTQ